jgi:hypothetical protein
MTFSLRENERHWRRRKGGWRRRHRRGAHRFSSLNMKFLKISQDLSGPFDSRILRRTGLILSKDLHQRDNDRHHSYSNHLRSVSEVRPSISPSPHQDGYGTVSHEYGQKSAVNVWTSRESYVHCEFPVYPFPRGPAQILPSMFLLRIPFPSITPDTSGGRSLVSADVRRFHRIPQRSITISWRG